MQLGGHQTFHLREGWIYKGLSTLSKNQDAFQDPNIGEHLGVGKNMVDSIRYWLRACALVDKKDGKKLRKIARTILEKDPFIELDGSLILLHYLLATNEDKATAWYWFFNKFGATEFDTESLAIYLQSFITNQYKKKPREQTIKREVACLLNCYNKPEYKIRETPETENPSPFVRFNVITKIGDKYRKNGLNPALVDPLVFCHLLHSFWDDHMGKPTTMSFEEVSKGSNSPGLVLGFTEDQSAQMLDRISKEFSGKYLEFHRTGGYFTVELFSKNSRNALREYYKKHKNLLEK